MATIIEAGRALPAGCWVLYLPSPQDLCMCAPATARRRFNDGPRLSGVSCSTLQAGRQAPHMLCRATHAFGVAEGFALVDGART